MSCRRRREGQRDKSKDMSPMKWIGYLEFVGKIIIIQPGNLLLKRKSCLLENGKILAHPKGQKKQFEIPFITAGFPRPSSDSYERGGEVLFSGRGRGGPLGSHPPAKKKSTSEKNTPE